MKALKVLAAGWMMASTVFSYGVTVPLKIDADQVRFIGNGCSNEDSFVDVNPDNSFDLIFTDFAVDSPSQSRVSKICAIKMPIKVPRGWQVAVSKVGFEGVAEVEDEGKALVSLRHRLAGTVGDAVIQEYYYDEFAQDVIINKNFNLKNNSYSACGSSVELKTSVKIQAQEGAIAIDEGAGGAQAKLRYFLHFRLCR